MLKAFAWGVPAGCALLALGLLGTEKGRKYVRGAAKGVIKVVNNVSEEAKGCLSQTQEIFADIVSEAKEELQEARHNGAAAHAE